MATERVTRVGALIRLAVLVSVRSTQVGALARIRQSTLNATQLGALVRVTPVTPYARTVAATVYVDWDRNGIFTDESANLIVVRGSSSLTAPQQALTSGKGMVDRCTIQLQNNDFRYSTLNEDSPLAADIGEGGLFQVPVYVDAIVDGATHRLFVGVIRAITENARTAKSAGTVTLDCRSKDDLLLQQRLSTPLADWLAAMPSTGSGAGGHTEDWHIIEMLEAGGMVDGIDFVSQAYADANSPNPTIDNGLFPVPYVWLDDGAPLETIWTLAAACGGWFYCDAVGKLHYHNLSGVLAEMMYRHYGPQTLVEIDESNSAQLALAWRDTDLFSEVTVAATALEPSEVGEIWATEAPIVLAPGETKAIWAKLTKPAVNTLTLDWAATSAGGADLTASVALTRTDYAQRIKLIFENGATRTAYITATLSGQTLDGGASEEEATATVDGADTFWTNRVARVRRITNEWIQRTAQAQSIADYVLARCQRPQLVASITNLDRPDVRVGRRCTVRYPGVMGEATEFEGLVMTSSWSLDRNGFRQSVEIFDSSRFFGGVTDFFVIGTNKLGATGTLTAPLFY